MGAVQNTRLDTAVCYTFRIRYAYLFFDTPRWTLMAGNFWHPLFLINCFPDTISFDNGAPIEPQARDPQVTFTYKGDSFQLIVAAAGQNTFTSPGPDNYTWRYLANAAIPNFHWQVRFLRGDFFWGVALDWKRLVPRLETTKCVDAHEHISSIFAEAFAAYNTPEFTFRSKIFYAENAADQLCISGYAIATQDPVTNRRTYANVPSVGGWIDTAYWFDEGSRSIGLFIGAGKNLGSSKPLFIDHKTKQPVVYALEPTLDSLFRIAPRARIIKKPMTIGLELEYTQAAFGKLDRFARARHPQTARNVRFLFEIIYQF